MVVKIAPYGVGKHDPEIQETEVFDYHIIARLNEPAESVVIIADPTGAKTRKYVMDGRSDLAGAVLRDDVVFTDYTTEISEDTDDDVFLLPNAASASAGQDGFYFGFASNDVTGFILNVTTAAVYGSGVLTWKYSDGAGTLANLAGVTDDTNTFQIAGINGVSWTVPGDWYKDTINGIEAYWVVAFVTTTEIWGGGEVIPKAGRAWSQNIYSGSGRITIEKPAATDIFDGRILKAIFDQGSKTVSLHCKDWMSQLDDVVITKDMREDLDGSGLREGQAHSELDSAFTDVAQNDGGDLFFYDDGDYFVAGAMAWANDQFNGMKLVLAASMEGTKTWRFHAYQGTPTAEDTYTDDYWHLWLDDPNNDRTSAPNDFTIDYDFRIYLGHDTPSDFYVHDSIKGARVGVVYQVLGGANNHSHLQVEDKTNPGTYFEQATLVQDDHFIRTVYELNADEYSHIIDANGIATVRFDVDRDGGQAAIHLRFLYLEVDVDTSGYDKTISIIDTINPNKLEVGTDLTAAATRIWEKINYCIVREAYKHIASNQTPGDLITDGSTGSGPDPLVVLTAVTGGTVEATSSFSTRRYENRIRLEVVQDLAQIDRVAFYMEIGTTVFTWKSTFNDGAPAALTDADVIRWTGERSFVDVRNSFILYGPKQNENLLRLDTADISPDPGADSKATYGVTRSRTVNNRGVNNPYELTELGTALVERDEDALLFLGCEIAGLSPIRLGDEISITSTHMGLTAQVQVVTEWEFGWRDNITKLRFHPRLSTKGFVPHRIFSNSIRRLGQDTERLDADVTYEAPEDSSN